MNIIVGFSKSKPWYKIGSKLIQLVEKRPYSHAYLRYKDPWTGVDLISQASHGFVNQFTFNTFSEQNEVIEEYVFSITDEQFRLLLETIENNLGKPYGYLEIILISIRKILHLEVSIYDQDTSFICSELVGRLLQVLGILKPINLDYLTPSDLNKLIKGE